MKSNLHYVEKFEMRRTTFGLLIIIFLFTTTAYSFFDMAQTKEGTYIVPLNLIILYPRDYSPGSISFAAHHEIGHYIWFQRLSPEFKTEYEKSYKQTNYFVSNYAHTSVEEDFAEEYAINSGDYGKIIIDRNLTTINLHHILKRTEMN